MKGKKGIAEKVRWKRKGERQKGGRGKVEGGKGCMTGTRIGLEVKSDDSK